MRMIAGKDLVACGRAISRGIRANKKEIRRRSESMKKRQPELVKQRRMAVRKIFTKTKTEKMLCDLFPEAIYNYCIATGKASKFHQAQIYWMDLCFPDVKLNVEVDGYHHSYRDQPRKDLERDKFLNGIGWKVLRFSNIQVMRDITKVCEAIRCTISELKGTLLTV